MKARLTAQNGNFITSKRDSLPSFFLYLQIFSGSYFISIPDSYSETFSKVVPFRRDFGAMIEKIDKLFPTHNYLSDFTFSAKLSFSIFEYHQDIGIIWGTEINGI